MDFLWDFENALFPIYILLITLCVRHYLAKIYNVFKKNLKQTLTVSTVMGSCWYYWHRLVALRDYIGNQTHTKIDK